LLALFPTIARSQDSKLETIDVEGQPLAANVTRLLQALDFLGSPLPKEKSAALEEAARNREARKLQELLDPHVLVQVTITPQLRVKSDRGPARVALQQEGYTPIVLKIINDGAVAKALRISSPARNQLTMSGVTVTVDTRALGTAALYIDNAFV